MTSRGTQLEPAPRRLIFQRCEKLGEAELLPDQAEAAARTYLADSGVDGDVVVTFDQITVTVRLQQPMRILPLPDRTVVASDTATAVASLTGEEPPS